MSYAAKYALKCAFKSAAAVLMLVAWQQAAALAQSAAPALTAEQRAGRDLFAQHCVVCHVRTLVTAVRTYGPSLSQSTLGGLDEVMRAFISIGDSNMPGFKYSLAPDEIGEIVAYIKTLPAEPPAAPMPAAH